MLVEPRQVAWICTDCGVDLGSANALTVHRRHRKCVRDAEAVLHASIGTTRSSIIDEAGHKDQISSLRRELIVHCQRIHVEKHVPHGALSDMATVFEDVFGEVHNGYMTHLAGESLLC